MGGDHLRQRAARDGLRHNLRKQRDGTPAVGCHGTAIVVQTRGNVGRDIDPLPVLNDIPLKGQSDRELAVVANQNHIEILGAAQYRNALAKLRPQAQFRACIERWPPPIEHVRRDLVDVNEVKRAG